MIVYCYTNKTNGKKYIGITSRTMKGRKQSHIYEAYNEKGENYNTPFKRAIRKYGIDGFEEEVLHDNVTQEQASVLEQHYIEKYQTYYKYQNSNGYNATIGGELTIAQPKDRVVQVDPNTYEVVYIFSSGAEAERRYGRGIYECCNRLINIPFGYVWYYEKDFLSMTREELEDDICTRLNKIVQLEKDGTFVRSWVGSTEASEALGLSQANISSCCLGDRQSCGGYMWMNYTDYKENGARKYDDSKQDRSKKVAQCDKDGNIIRVFSSATQASKETSTCLSSISNVCKGKRAFANGYKWKYI